MLIEDHVASIHTLETADEVAEARIEAVGFVFHGTIPESGGKRTRAGANTLHFARCAKLDRVAEHETKIWFRTIRIAKAHLDEVVGEGRWKWCKNCEREITQKILNER
jgi:hypothetical protein